MSEYMLIAQMDMQKMHKAHGMEYFSLNNKVNWGIL